MNNYNFSLIIYDILDEIGCFLTIIGVLLIGN